MSKIHADRIAELKQQVDELTMKLAQANGRIVSLERDVRSALEARDREFKQAEHVKRIFNEQLAECAKALTRLANR